MGSNPIFRSNRLPLQTPLSRRLMSTPLLPDSYRTNARKSASDKTDWRKKIAKAMEARRAGEEMRAGRASTLSTKVRIKL